MTSEISKADLDDLQTKVIIIAAVLGSLIAVAIVFGIVITIYSSRLLKKLNQMSLTVKTTRLDVRKTLETVENSIVKSLVVNSFDDNFDGTEQASPIFTSRIFQSSPVPFNQAEGARGDDYDRNKNGRRQGPPVPPKRAHSFYDGPYY